MDVLDIMQKAINDHYEPDVLMALDKGMEEIEQLRKKFNTTLNSNFRQMKEIDRLREVVILLIGYDEHDKNTDKSEILWDVLIEAAHDALKDKDD